MIVRADIALQTQPLDKARAAVQDALSAVRTNPLVFHEFDVRRLEQKLAALAGPAPILQQPDPVA